MQVKKGNTSPSLPCHERNILAHLKGSVSAPALEKENPPVKRNDSGRGLSGRKGREPCGFEMAVASLAEREEKIATPIEFCGGEGRKGRSSKVSGKGK